MVVVPLSDVYPVSYHLRLSSLVPLASRCCFPTTTTPSPSNSCCCTSLLVVVVVVPLSDVYPVSYQLRLSHLAPLASLLDWALLRCLLALLRGASCIGRLSLERGYLTGGNPSVTLTTFPHLLLFWAGACKKQPILAGLALARERGIGTTSRRAGFSFAVASAATTTRRSPRYHHPSNIWLAGYHSVSISIRFWSASLWWSHSQSSSALPLSPFSAHIHALCCGAVVYNFFPPSTTLCMFLLRFLHPLFIYSTLLRLHLPVITFVVFSLLCLPTHLRKPYPTPALS